MVDKHSHFKGLRKDHIAVPNVPGHNETTHMRVFDPVSEPFVLGAVTRRIVAVASHYDQLSNAIAQGERAEKRRSGGGSD
jgi:hypothetical protein